MGVELAQLFVRVRADTRPAQQDIKKAQGSLMRSASATAAKLAAAFGVAFGIRGMLRFASESIELAERQEQAEQRLAATLKATGNAAGFSAQKLQGYAKTLQKATAVGDEEILESMALLATFKSISGDVFKRAEESALDLSAAGFGELKNTTIQLAKALENPTKGLNAMARSGVTFSDQQKEQIMQLQEQNDLLGAQEIILEAVEGQVKGTARALAQTQTGRIRGLRNEILDLKEVIGGQLQPTLEEMLKLYKSFLEMLTGSAGPLQTISVLFKGWAIAFARARVELEKTWLVLKHPIQAGDFMIGRTDLVTPEWLAARQRLMNEGKILDEMMMRVGNREAGQVPPGAIAPRGFDDVGGGGKNSFEAFIAPLENLAAEIQNRLLDDDGDKMVDLLEKNNAIQAEQLKQTKETNRLILGEFRGAAGGLV